MEAFAYSRSITVNRLPASDSSATQPVGLGRLTCKQSNGPALDNLNARAFEAFDEAMREFANTTGTTVNLFHWIGAQIMRATTDAVYGPRNPMRETKNLDAWQ